jgi:hypothetical protein
MYIWNVYLFLLCEREKGLEHISAYPQQYICLMFGAFLMKVGALTLPCVSCPQMCSGPTSRASLVGC